MLAGMISNSDLSSEDKHSVDKACVPHSLHQGYPSVLGTEICCRTRVGTLEIHHAKCLMRELCTLRPVMNEPLPGPRSGCCSMKLATLTFSPPWSERSLLDSP